jgi:hypothetical protein
MKVERFPAGVELLAVLVLLALAAPGCAGGREGLTAQAEVRPPRPGKRAVWVPGHWEWVDRKTGYRWVEGHWRIP